MPRRVFDCFLYNGEPILDLRLQCLGPHVDRFVIVESALTFKGDAKPPRFRGEMAGPWAHKVDYVLLGADDHDGCHSAWDREALQRNAIRRGLATADDDTVALFTAALANPHAPGTDIARAMTDRGYPITAHTRQRHRRGECRCGA